MQAPLLPASDAVDAPNSPNSHRLGLRPNGGVSADEELTGVLNPHDDPWHETLKRNLKPTSGDVNAFFAIILDNLANLTSMTGVLVFGFGMPASFVYKNMIPGTTFGMMIGTIYLAILALRLDRHYRRTNRAVLVTAIPLGLDAPTTVTLPLLVIGPAFAEAKQNGLSEADAAQQAFHYGCATVFMIGLVKLCLASVGKHVQAAFHATGKQVRATTGVGVWRLAFGVDLHTI